MKKCFRIIVVFLSLCLMGCGNILHWYSHQLHKKLLRKGFSAHIYKTDTSQVFFYDNERENAPILLFIHGFGGDGKLTWKNQMTYFCKNYRVIVPDLLWFGKSKSTAQASLMTEIRSLKVLVEHLRLRKINMVGISYGGFVSIGYAQLFPKDLISLVIVDSPGPCISDMEINDLCMRFCVDSIEDAFVPRTAMEVERLVALSFYNKPFIPHFIAKQALGTYVSKYPERQRQLIRDLFLQRDFLKPSTIDVSTLILWGKEDKIFLLDEAYDLSKKMNAKLIIIPKAGHMLPADQGKDFNHSLENFIR